MQHPSLQTDSTPVRAAETTRPKLLVAAVAILFAVASVFVTFDYADAKRFGGGKSFGSKRSYSSGYDKPAAPSRTQDAQRAAPGQPGRSAFGGMGGMLGGMLMGGLLGSMLFGGGGFGGPGIMDLLLLGGLAFLGYKLLKRRRASAQPAPATATAGAGYQTMRRESAPPPPPAGGTPGGWGNLDSEPAAPEAAEPAGPAIPEDFDADGFLNGAKTLFNRLQTSWDKRDMDDIRQFVTPEVMAEIEAQAAEDTEPSRTDILMVEARLLEFDRHDEETVVTVLFDALMREEAGARESKQVREVWRFSRDESAAAPEWRLEGLQQLEM